MIIFNRTRATSRLTSRILAGSGAALRGFFMAAVPDLTPGTDDQFQFRPVAGSTGDSDWSDPGSPGSL